MLQLLAVLVVGVSVEILLVDLLLLVLRAAGVGGRHGSTWAFSLVEPRSVSQAECRSSWHTWESLASSEAKMGMIYLSSSCFKTQRSTA